MTGFEQLLSALQGELDAFGVHWALVGGHSVSVRCEPRFTRDLDVVVDVPGDDEAERLVRDLASGGYRVRTVVEQTATKRLALVRLTPPLSPEGPFIDLLFASSGIEAEVVASAETLEVFPGVMAPVARVPHLIALKLLSVDEETRPQDRLDLQALLAVASDEDISETRRVLDLIEHRGTHRGRDLSLSLEAALGLWRRG